MLRRPFRCLLRVTSGKAVVRELDQPQPLEAGMTVLADDDVIVHRDAERARDGNDLLRRLNVDA